MKATKPNQHQIKRTLMPTSLALQNNDNKHASPTPNTICIYNTSSQGYNSFAPAALWWEFFSKKLPTQEKCQSWIAQEKTQATEIQ